MSSRIALARVVELLSKILQYGQDTDCPARTTCGSLRLLLPSSRNMVSQICDELLRCVKLNGIM